MPNLEEAVKQSLWCEVYRPKTIEDMVLSDKDSNLMKKIIEKEELPHLLFFGKPGTGKTTLGRILLRAIVKSEEDFLHLNGSESRGIDTVREKIIPFMAIPPYKSKYKIVNIDEADHLTEECFASLRCAMEDPSFNIGQKTRFIFTCNYINKIPDPIKSRCTLINYDKPPLEKVIERCKYILDTERIQYTDEVVQQIVEDHIPDLRSVVNCLELSVNDGVLENRSIRTNYEQLKDCLKRLLLAPTFETAYQCRSEFVELFNEDYDARDLLMWVLDEFIEDPLIHVLAFHYLQKMDTSIDSIHTVVAFASEVLLAKFSM